MPTTLAYIISYIWIVITMASLILAGYFVHKVGSSGVIIAVSSVICTLSVLLFINLVRMNRVKNTEEREAEQLKQQFREIKPLEQKRGKKG